MSKVTIIMALDFSFHISLKLNVHCFIDKSWEDNSEDDDIK